MYASACLWVRKLCSAGRRSKHLHTYSEASQQFCCSLVCAESKETSHPCTRLGTQPAWGSQTLFGVTWTCGPRSCGDLESKAKPHLQTKFIGTDVVNKVQGVSQQRGEWTLCWKLPVTVLNCEISVRQNIFHPPLLCPGSPSPSELLLHLLILVIASMPLDLHPADRVHLKVN